MSRLNLRGATLVDTGPLVAWFARSDQDHRTCAAFFSARSGVLVSTGPVLTEVCHLVPPEVAPRFLEWIQLGGLLLQDLPPGALADRLLDAPLRGSTDGPCRCLVALGCASSGLRRIVTLDRRDFGIYRLPGGKASAMPSMNSTDEGVTSDSGLRMGHASITPARLKWDRQPPRSIAHPQPWRPRRRRLQGRAGAEGDPAAPGRIAALRVRTRHNKARSVSSGLLSAQPWCLPEGKGAAVRSKDRQICLRFFGCGGGAAGAGTWGHGSSGTFRGVRGTSGWAFSRAFNDAVDGDVATRQEHQRSVESVGAGAGSSARSWRLLRWGVIHGLEPPLRRWCHHRMSRQDPQGGNGETSWLLTFRDRRSSSSMSGPEQAAVGLEGFPVRAAVPDVEPLLRWQRCGASLMLFAAELSADAETCEGRSMGLQRCHYRCFRVR